MPRVSTSPGERASGGFFKAGPYLILAAGYQVHQFKNKDGKAAGNPFVGLGIEIVQLEDGVKSLKDAKIAADALRIDQWYTVGGNPELFHPCDEDGKKTDKGQFIGSSTMPGIFDDSSAAQFIDALINSGYDQDRWKEHEAHGLPGTIVILSEVPDKKAPPPADRKQAANSRMAQEAKEAGADKKERDRRIVVASEVIDTPDDVHGEELPKKLWPKGTPATVATLAERSKKKDGQTGGGNKGNGGGDSSNGSSDSDNGGGTMSEEELNEVLREAARTAVGDATSKVDPILKGGIVSALGAMGLDEDNLKVLREMVADADTRSAIMTSIGFTKSGANWKKG